MFDPLIKDARNHAPPTEPLAPDLASRVEAPVVAAPRAPRNAPAESAVNFDMSPFAGVSNLHLNAADVGRSILFPGPRRMPECAVQAAEALVQACERMKKQDFMVWDANDICWRGRRDGLAVDGVWFRLRRMPEQAPTLDTLPTPMSAPVRKLLMSPMLSTGGLIYVIGSPGSGKTTSGSATLVSRLHRFGGYAYTVEDPPEMPINGWHGEGYCAQSWVPGDRQTDWMEAMRGALRSQPSGTPSMLYVGEVRDPESARTMLRAASSGFLVIATGFGGDIVNGLDTLLQLTGDEAVATLAVTLRLVVHQRLVDGHLVAHALASQGATSQVAMRLRNGQLTQLAGDVQHQANMMRVGQDPLGPHS